MEDKVKKYCEWEYMNALKRGHDPHEATTRCYGALMFVLNFSEDTYDEDLANWWDDEMLPKFRELESGGNA